MSGCDGRWRLRQIEGFKPFKSDDPDSERTFWQEGGVLQNLTFPVHPDPVSGMHCWHQRVRVERAHADDKYGDVVVDTNRSDEVYRKWLEMTRPAPGPGGLRRPLWFSRPVRSDEDAYLVQKIRYFGFMANRHRAHSLALAAASLEAIRYPLQKSTSKIGTNVFANGLARMSLSVQMAN